MATKSKPKMKLSKSTQKNILETGKEIKMDDFKNSKVFLQKLQNQLRNLDDTSRDVKPIIDIKAMHKISKIYHYHESLRQLCARVITLIYRNIDYRDQIMEISETILPLFLQTYEYLNQYTIADCLKWLYFEGKILNFNDSLLESIATKIKKTPRSFLLIQITKLMIVEKNSLRKPNQNVLSLKFCKIFTQMLIAQESFSIQFCDCIMQGFISQVYQVTQAPDSLKNEEYNSIFFQWAFLSLKKQFKYQSLFQGLMNKIGRQNFTKISNISFASSILVALGDQKKSARKKFLVLIEYSHLIIHLIQQIDFEDNLSQTETSVIIQSIFHLAKFCDSIKAKQSISDLLSKLSKFIQENENQWALQSCENIIYRIILCAEKCLPKYAVKYYLDLYIQRPDFFHLYFIDDIIKKREPSEIKDLFVNLVEKWIKHDLRDFNMLGYLSKFFYNFIRSEIKLKTITTFFKEISLKSLQSIAQIFYDNSFSEGMTSISPIPTTLCSLQQSSEIKACGFLSRSLFIDRYFPTRAQLIAWQPIVEDLIEDTFYFCSKYFFYAIDAFLNSEQQSSDKNQQSISPINEIIARWIEAIKINNSVTIFAMFQIIYCADKLQITQLKKIGQAIFSQHKKLLQIFQAAQTVWRESLKNLDPSDEVIENYSRKQKKYKKCQIHLARSILSFLEKFGAQIDQIIPDYFSYEDAIDIVKKYQTSAGIVSYRAYRIFSMKASRNIFAEEASKCLKKHIDNRQHYEIMREIIFGHLTYNSQFQKENLLKLISLDSCLSECVNFLASTINPMLQKQIISCKMIAFDAVMLCFRHTILKLNHENSGIMNQSFNTLIDLIYCILNKTTTILGKYERKSILILRCECIQLISQLWDKNIFADHRQQALILLTELSLDESPQIRICIIKCLSIILKQLANQNNADVNKEYFSICLCILHIVSSLDPKNRIRSISNKIIQLYGPFFNVNRASFGYLLIVTLQYIICNLQAWINIPAYDIIANIIKVWLPTKQLQYLAYIASQGLEYNGGKVKQMKRNSMKNHEGFRIYQLNPKQRKGWVNGKSNIKEKDQSVLDTFRKCLSDKNKNTRFLKSKKQSIFIYDDPQVIKFLDFNQL